MVERQTGQVLLGRSLHDFEILCQLKRRPEPAFTSAEVRRASKSCSRGRFCAISYTLKRILPQKTKGSQTVDKKLFSPEEGRIPLSANERIAEFLDFAIQAKFAYVNKLSGLSPPLPPPKSATHQSLAHAGDFTQFPIHLKKTLPQKTEGSKRRIYLLVAPQDFAASLAPSVISIRPSGKTQRASTSSRDSMNARLSSYGIRNAAVESRSA